MFDRRFGRTSYSLAFVGEAAPASEQSEDSVTYGADQACDVFLRRRIDCVKARLLIEARAGENPVQPSTARMNSPFTSRHRSGSYASG